MRNYVIINGVNSLTKNGLAIRDLPPITKTMMRTLREEIDGRDGDIITELGYSAYDKSMTIGLFGTGYDIDDIIAFFNQSGTIVFSNEPDKFYNFKIIDQIDYNKLLKFKEATIRFHCQPFKYPLNEIPLEEEYQYVNGTGTDITLDNTSEAIFNKIELQGNTFQQTYTGQNLLPNNAITRTVNGITFTKNNDGSITINGTCTGNVDLYFVGDYSNYVDFGLTTGSYNLNGCTGGSEQTYMLFAVLRRNGNVYYYSSVNASGRVMIVEAGDEFRIFIRVFNGQVLNNITIYPQVNAGNTALPYIPYVGGIPSPNPEYPQDIRVVSGDNYIDICGKNLNKTSITANLTSGNEKWTGTRLDEVNWENGKTYYIKAFLEKQSNEVVQITNYGYKTIDNKRDIIVFNGDIPYVRVGANTLNANVTNEEVKIMVSTEAFTDFEPYTGQTYPLYLGVENLYDSEVVQGFYTADGNISSSNTQIRTTEYIEVEPNTIYTFSNTNNLVIDRICYYDSSKTFIERGAYLNSGTFTTLNNNCKYIRFTIRASDGSNITPNSLVNPQLAIGTNHISDNPIEMASIPNTDYKDTFVKIDDVWYKREAVGKFVLDGSESWAKYSGTKRYYLQMEGILAPLSNNEKALIISNRFIVQTANYTSSATTVDAIALQTDEILLVRYVAYNNETLANFKSELSTNNLIICSPLATPTNTLIEDTTLIEQLEAIKNAVSREGQTNVTQTNNDLPFILDLSALELNSDHLVINNIGNIYSKPTLDLEGTGIVDIYLNDIQMFEVDLTETNEIIINTDEMEAFNPETGALANRLVTGEYDVFKLESGENDLRFSGNLTKATITNYERWL